MNNRILRVTVFMLALVLALVGVAAVAAPRVNAATGAEPTAATDGAYLGISVVTLNARTAKQLGLQQTEGVAIASVVTGSPAAAAGLKKGDIVNAVNGVAVKTAQEVVAEVQKAQAGDVVTLDITRAGAIMSVQVTSVAAPAKIGRGERQPKATPDGGATPRVKPAPSVPSELQPLYDIPSGERFDSYYGSTHTYKDANGNTITIRVIPGTVTAISETSITIKPNNPESNGGPYTIDDTTLRSTGDIKVDDKVTVVVVGDSSHATVISRGSVSLFGGHSFGFTMPSGRGSFDFKFEMPDFKFEMPGGMLDRFRMPTTPSTQDKGA